MTASVMPRAELQKPQNNELQFELHTVSTLRVLRVCTRVPHCWLKLNATRGRLDQMARYGGAGNCGPSSIACPQWAKDVVAGVSPKRRAGIAQFVRLSPTPLYNYSMQLLSDADA